MRKGETADGAEPSGGDGVRGRDVVPRPMGLPQALEPGAQQMVGAQQATGPLPGGGQGRAAPVVAGRLASSYGELLKAWLVRLALSCGPWVMHFVLELKVILVYVGPSGLLPLQGLPAGRLQGSDQGVGDRNGGQPRGGNSGSLLGPLAKPLPPLVEFNLPQDQPQRESPAVPHQPAPQPQGSQPAAVQNQGGMMGHATQLGPGMGSQEMVTQANQLGPRIGTLMMVTPVRP